MHNAGRIFELFIDSRWDSPRLVFFDTAQHRIYQLDQPVTASAIDAFVAHKEPHAIAVGHHTSHIVRIVMCIAAACLPATVLSSRTWISVWHQGYSVRIEGSLASFSRCNVPLDAGSS